MISVPLLVGWALRSAILIVSGAVLLKVLRVQDPAVRLAAWAAMLCASLAIPLLTATLPSIPVRPRPAAIPQAVAVESARVPLTAVLQQEDPMVPSRRRFDWVVATYMVIAGAFLLRLGIGLAMSVRLRYRSLPTSEPGVRESDGIASPVSLGVVRPVIVLPVDWRAWDAAKLAAVLAHERSHIRRRDPMVQVLSAIHRALLWYSPLSWYLDRQIVRLAEQASDDAAVAAMRDRTSYAEVLLEFMQRGVRRASWQGVPMARYGQPEQRIHRILALAAEAPGVSGANMRQFAFSLDAESAQQLTQAIEEECEQVDVFEKGVTSTRSLYRFIPLYTVARGPTARTIILRFLLSALYTIRYASLPNRRRYMLL